mgnify:FL=1
MTKSGCELPLDSFHDKDGFFKGVCWGLALTGVSGMFGFGYALSVIDPMKEYLTEAVFHWKPEEAESFKNLTSLVCSAGGIIGAISGGILARMIGRKTTMILADFIGFIGFIFTIVGSFPLLLAGRVLEGLYLGINSGVIPVYLHEMIPLSLRDSTGSTVQIFNSMGSLAALLIGLGLPKDGTPTWWWRLMLGLPMVFCLLRAVLLLTVFNFETPKYLIIKGRTQSAVNVLRKIYKEERYVQEQVSALKQDLKDQQGSFSGKFKSLYFLTSRWRHRFSMGVFVAAIEPLTFMNGVFYTTLLFEDVTQSQESAEAWTCIVMSVTVVATICGTWTTSKGGRKTIMLIGAAAIAILWGSVTVFLEFKLEVVSRAPIFLFVIVYGLTFGPIVWTYVAEVLPDIAVGIALLVNWIFQLIVDQVFPILVESLPKLGYLIPSAVPVIMFVVILKFVKETKDKTPLEITEIYDSDKKAVADSENLSLHLFNSKASEREKIWDTNWT